MNYLSALLSKTKNIIKSFFKKNNSQLVTNMLIVGGMSLLIKGISFGKEILIAEKYGVSELLDTFLIAVLVPTFIQSVFINAYGSVFIPNYLLEKKLTSDTGSFQSTSFLITILIGIVMIIVTYFGIDNYLEYLFPGHSTAYYSLVKSQLWLILPAMLFWAISSLISGLLMSDNEFLLSSASAIFIPLSMIICMVFYESLQERTLALGMLLGSILSTIFLIFVGINKKLLKLRKPNFHSDNIRIYLSKFQQKFPLD